jgi:PAS domain S-box-containing protein
MISYKKVPLISFKTAVILAFIVVIIFPVISILLRNESTLRMIFSDLTLPIIELLVIISLFYAARRSAAQGRYVDIGWMLMTVAFLSYLLGGIISGILQMGLHQTPSPSIADIFYLSFYPLFALGIYYLPKISFTQKEKFKIVIDISIVLITVGLIFWTFLIIPTLSKQENFFSNIISVIYILGDFVLLFVLLRLFYSKFEEVYYGPLILLGMGVIALIVTDIIVLFQTVHGTYTAGGLLDTGWILSFVLIGLAAFLQSYEKHFKPHEWFKIRFWLRRSILTSYLPLIWVLIAFILLAWANENQSIPHFEQIEFGVGFIIFLVLLRQIITLNENKNLYLEAEKEINNRKKAEKELKESEINYRAIFENTGTATILIDDDMTISKVNSEFERLTAFSKEEIEGNKKWTDFAVKEELNKLLQYYALRKKPEEAPREYETRGKDKEGNIKDLLVTVSNIPGTGKELVSILDITKRKRSEIRLKNTLDERELLIKEIHHRVKNNMQIISSLLNLQKAYLEGEEAINVLQESQNRVSSMAMIHEMLYQSENLTHINFTDYIQRLVSELISSYPIKDNITPIIETDDINLNIETAAPFGLIINELVSNSIKYAFPHDKTGKISINLKYYDDKYKLTISDNGVGFPENLDFRNIESTLGLKLVNSLVKQLDGSIDLDTSQGTKFTIKFKELKYKKRI